MKHTLFPAVLLLVVLTVSSRSAQAGSDASTVVVSSDSVEALARSGIHLSINDRFRSADSVFVDLTETAALSPLGPLFAAGNLQAEMLDRESDEHRERFLANVELAEIRAESRIAERGYTLAEDEFVLGVAEGYRAVYESRWGGWFAALKSGLRAKKHFDSALRLDTTLCDAYLGLGSYHYWKSAKTDWVNWLPIVSDARNEGIAMLIRAADCGTYTRAAAHAALASAYINDERYPEALAHSDTLSQLAPYGKAHLWLKGKARYALYEWDSTVLVFDELEDRIREDGPGNYFNLIECAYYRAQCHWGSGQYQQARDECGRALTYPAPEEVKNRQRKRLDELRAMQRKLLKLLSKG